MHHSRSCLSRNYSFATNMVAECFGPWDYPCNEDRRWARRRPHLFLQPVFHTGLRKKQRFAFFWSITCHNPRTSLTSEGPAMTLDMEVSEGQIDIGLQTAPHRVAGLILSTPDMHLCNITSLIRCWLQFGNNPAARYLHLRLQ